jgi:hypothetical protein
MNGQREFDEENGGKFDSSIFVTALSIPHCVEYGPASFEHSSM